MSPGSLGVLGGSCTASPATPLVLTVGQPRRRDPRWPRPPKRRKRRADSCNDFGPTPTAFCLVSRPLSPVWLTTSRPGARVPQRPLHRVTQRKPEDGRAHGSGTGEPTADGAPKGRPADRRGVGRKAASPNRSGRDVSQSPILQLELTMVPRARSPHERCCKSDYARGTAFARRA